MVNEAMPALLTCEKTYTVLVFSRAFLPVPLLGEIKMANQANQPAVSAVAPLLPAELLGKPYDEVKASLEEIGLQSQKAENRMAEGEMARDVCDANLADWLKGCDWPTYKLCREFVITGRIDAGKTPDAAEQAWNRQVKRMVANCGFVVPSSGSKDAKRMSEKAAKRKAELEAKTDLELEAERTELIEKGDSKSLRVAGELAKEIEARAKPEMDKAKATAKMMADAIIQRTRELAKSATPDAIEILIRMVQASK